MRARAVLLAAAAAAALLLPAGATAAPAPTTSAAATDHRPHVPVFAYFYQWFDAHSWRRAKIDFPLVGRYSSSDRKVLVHQVQQARSAGIDGFLTSWKGTPSLDMRLQMLLSVAHQQHFDVGVVYEALDFQRNPLPVQQVRSDITMLVDRWGNQLRSRYFGRPVVIWTGTDQFPVSAIASVKRALGDRAWLLASAKSAQEYDRVAGVVDGDAYYWSSAHPGTSYTRDRLTALSRAVHRHHGIWIAPATAGFDGRPLDHHRVVGRAGGQTLVRSLQDAFGSNPDAVGVISWNEWSENTYIEPGRRYGSQELDALRAYLLHGASAATALPPTTRRPAEPGPSLGAQGWTGARAGLVLAVGTVVAIVVLLTRARRPRHRGQTGGWAGGPPRERRPDEPATPERQKVGQSHRPGPPLA
jgi:hypothetical protein